MDTKIAYKDQNKIFVKIKSFGHTSNLTGVLVIGFLNRTQLREWILSTYPSIKKINKSASVYELIKFYRDGYVGNDTSRYLRGLTTYQEFYFYYLTRAQYLAEFKREA